MCNTYILPIGKWLNNIFSKCLQCFCYQLDQHSLVLRNHSESTHTKKKIIKIWMEFELIHPPKLCYTSIATYVLWKLTVPFLSAGPIFAGVRYHFESVQKKRKEDKTWINTTPTHFISAIEYALICI